MARVRFSDGAYFFFSSRCLNDLLKKHSVLSSRLTVAQLVERGTVNATAVIPRSMVRIRPVRLYLAEWPSGLRRWFKAPVSSEAWVRTPLQSVLEVLRSGGLAQSVECVVSNDEAPGSKPGFSTFLFSLRSLVGRALA